MSVSVASNHGGSGVAAVGSGRVGAQLPPWVQAGRVVLFALIAALMLYFLSHGTMEGRTTYVLAFLLGFVNPLWALYAMALMGPLHLLDAGKIHMLAGQEVFFLGMAAGELRTLGSERDSREKVYWGVWPHFLLGLFVLLVSSAMVGMQLLLLTERNTGFSNLRLAVDLAFYGAATEPEWTLKSLWNWSTGMLVAVIAARRMDEMSAARWLKLGGVGLLVACCLGLMDWLGTKVDRLSFVSLVDLRAVNPDPLQAGRLQGTAGHPGWFAQWIVVMWPGLFLWWSAGRGKRNAALIAAFALVGLTLVLTAARAAWLGMAVSGSLGLLYVLRTYPAAKRALPWVIGSAVLIAVVGVVIGGETLSNRLVHLLRTQDRARYWVTGLMFLREHPLGLGLGTHFRFYEWWVSPYFRWYQMDHVDSHNLWLHTWIENGPLVPLLILGGFAGLGYELRRSWYRFDLHQRNIAVALGLTLVGLMVVSIAQYIVYIRAVELALWVAGGTLVSLCRRSRARTTLALDSAKGRRLLLLCGAFAVLMATVNAQRAYPGEMPRLFMPDSEGEGFTFWTGARWHTYVDSEPKRIEFFLMRKATPANVVITWPDGEVERVRLEPQPPGAPPLQREAVQYFSREFHLEKRNWFEPQYRLTVETTPLWTPAEDLPDSMDTRGLGVYLGRLKMVNLREESK